MGNLIANIGKTGFTTTMTVGQHDLIADESTEYGGQNLGPTPYEYLCASLGSCTAMTLRMWADKYKIPLETVEVEVYHERIYAKDCTDCVKQKGMIDILNRSIKVTGNLSDFEKEKLLSIADRCPVHKTLENEIKIVTEGKFD